MHNREEVHMQKRHVLQLQDRIGALDARNLLNSTISKECNASTRIYHKYSSLKENNFISDYEKNRNILPASRNHDYTSTNSKVEE